jgi:hypothetical protein
MTLTTSSHRKLRIIPGRHSIAATVWRLGHPRTWNWALVASVLWLSFAIALFEVAARVPGI